MPEVIITACVKNEQVLTSWWWMKQMLGGQYQSVRSVVYITSSHIWYSCNACADWWWHILNYFNNVFSGWQPHKALNRLMFLRSTLSPWAGFCQPKKTQWILSMCRLQDTPYYFELKMHLFFLHLSQPEIRGCVLNSRYYFSLFRSLKNIVLIKEQVALIKGYILRTVKCICLQRFFSANPFFRVGCVSNWRASYAQRNTAYLYMAWHTTQHS
jgi:hypothetical protein